MKNPNFFLIFLGSSLFIILFTCILTSKSWFPSKETPIPEIIPQESRVSLFLSQSEISGRRLVLSLSLDPGGERVTAIDTIISYNPEVLSFVGIEPGVVFEAPIILKKEVNQEKGEIRLAIASNNPTQQKGSVTRLIYTLREGISEPIEIKIVEEKSQVSAIGKIGNVLGESTNLLLKPIIYE